MRGGKEGGGGEMGWRGGKEIRHTQDDPTHCHHIHVQHHMFVGNEKRGDVKT